LSAAWRPSDPPPHVRISAAGWLRAVLRGLPLALVTFGGLVLLLVLRLFERPFYGLNRPVTPHITQFVCRAAFVILGIGLSIRGVPMRARGALVANHASWLDIFALNAPQRLYFVAKSEVAGWPAIGWLARATGTVFINRSGREAQLQKLLFEARLRANHRLLFFPEGTSTDGIGILPFKSTLFEAFFSHGLKDILHVQPVTLIYHAPDGQDPRFYAWWGDMNFGTHMLRVLAASPQGRVDVVFHDPVRVSDFQDRKALAAYCEVRIRDALPRRAGDNQCD